MDWRHPRSTPRVHALSLHVFCTFELGEEVRHDPGLLPLPYNLKEVTFAFVALITDSETKALPVGGHSSQGTQGVEMGLLKMGKHYNCGLLGFFFLSVILTPLL